MGEMTKTDMKYLTAEEAKTLTKVDYENKIQIRMNKIFSNNEKIINAIMNAIVRACADGEYMVVTNVSPRKYDIDLDYDAIRDIEWFLIKCGYKIESKINPNSVTYIIDWRVKDIYV